MDKDGTEKYDIIVVFNSDSKTALTTEQKEEIIKQSTLCKMKRTIRN